MQTNFFRQLANLNLTGDLQITLRPTKENRFVLSIMLNNEQCGDEAKKIIPPLNLRGTAEELDNGFFESISTPLQTASGLMVDIENFMKQLEEAKKKSAMEKEKSDREKRKKKQKRRNIKKHSKKPKNWRKRVDIKKRGRLYQRFPNIPILPILFVKSKTNTKNILLQVFLLIILIIMMKIKKITKY